MRFEVGEIEQLSGLVKRELSQGNYLIALDAGSDELGLHDLNFFNNDYDAMEFCYENSTDKDNYVVRPASEVFKLLIEQAKENNSEDLNRTVMKQENYDYLINQVKTAGFEGLEDGLKEKMEAGESTFQLKKEIPFGDDRVEAVLNFRKSDQNENFYFNNFEAQLKHPEGSKKPEPKQTFYMGRNNNYTIEEANNLLNNRFVNKDLVTREGENYNGWVKLNFKQNEPSGNYKMQYYTERYKFDLETALDKFPEIKQLSKELNDGADRANLIDSLKKGNKAEVTYVKDGIEKKAFVVANVYNRYVSVTDENDKKIARTQKEDISQKQGESQGEKNNAETSENKSEKNNKRRGQSV